MDPLATRPGMIDELLHTAEYYPFIFVVVADEESTAVLAAMILDRVSGQLEGMQLHLQQCCVRFGREPDSQHFGGTIPIFWDPIVHRKAA